MSAPTAPAKRTPRKRAASAKDQLVPGIPASSKPEEPEEEFEGFDLDNLDKKTVLPDVTDKPYRFKLDGDWYTMCDPRDVDWKDVMDGIQNPILFMRLALEDPEIADKFIGVKLPGWKLSALFDNWQLHFGVDGLTDLNKLLSGRSGPQSER